MARARELGAWAAVNYRTSPDWDKEVWRLTERRGAKVEVRVARMLAAWGARTMFALSAPPAFAPFATFAPLTPPAFLSTMVAISQTVFAPVPALANCRSSASPAHGSGR